MLDAIRVSPGDDDLRLVYADALAEDGDAAQAEFIHLQVARARRAAEANGESGDDVDDRIAALEDEHGERFAGPIAELADEWAFDRGLVDAITTDIVSLARDTEALLGGPPIHALTLVDPGERTPIRDAERDAVCVAAATALATSSCLRTIRTIRTTPEALSGTRAGGAILEALLTSPHLVALESYVDGGETYPAIARALAAAASRLPSLRSLVFMHDLGAGALRDEGAIAIADSPLGARIEVFQAVGCRIGVAGARGLARGLPNVRFLSLPHTTYETNPLGREGAEALAAAPFAGLRQLELGGTAIGDDGLAAIASARWFGALERLEIDAIGLTDASVPVLAALDAPALQHLDLAENTLHARAIEALASARLPSLRSLSLADTGVDDAGLEALFAASWFAGLETLVIHGCKMTNRAALALAAHPTSSLRKLVADDPSSKARAALVARFGPGVVR